MLAIASMVAAQTPEEEPDLDGQEGCVCAGTMDALERERGEDENVTWVSVGSCNRDPNECQSRCEAEAEDNSVRRDSVTSECQNETPVGDMAKEKLKRVSFSTFSGLVATILRAALGLTGSIALLMFVYGGLIWLTSGGSPDKIKKAQGILVWATLGLVLIFASYAIIDTILVAFSL